MKEFEELAKLARRLLLMEAITNQYLAVTAIKEALSILEMLRL